jgi:hypothetical protein
MATVIGNRTRGRRKEALRLTAASLVAALGAPGADTETTVELLPAEGKQKAENCTLVIPKGAAVIPFALTSTKSDENAREQIRKGAEDAGVKISIQSILVAFDREGVEPSPVWVVTRTDAPEKPVRSRKAK